MSAMFTGIVTDIGTVEALVHRGDLRARIGCGYSADSIAIGASIACDGVCLTVIDRGTLPDSRTWFDVDISAETVARTTIGGNRGGWVQGHRINLERALRVGDELGGHIVSGHVDGTVGIESIRPEGDSRRFTFVAPDALAPFIAQKGSVALNGTSLTVNAVDGSRFGVNMIPHTLAVTTWGAARAGDAVNLEIDTLARYIARLAEAGRAG
jgi:riboflavin synthase